MACPAVLSGDQFLARVLDHLDCQAQALGNYGFQSLAAPGSPAATVLASLLTLFIAFLGYRLLFRSAPSAGDLVNDALKVGIVLTLALSWPAWKILAYDVVLHGPAEVVAAIAPATLGDAGTGIPARLVEIERGIQALTAAGTGRNSGAILATDAATGGFAGVAPVDDEAFSNARSAFLAGTIAPLAVLRLGGGLLLGVAPLVAALLLFGATRGILAGWLRGLVFVMAGSVAMAILLAAEATILESWLADALRVRSLGYALPSAPTELFAMTAAFALASAGLLFILVRVSFYRGWQTLRTVSTGNGHSWMPSSPPASTRVREVEEISRAARISEGVRLLQHHESSRGDRRTALIRERSNELRAPGTAGPSPTGGQALGSSWNRASRRTSGISRRRDASR